MSNQETKAVMDFKIQLDSPAENILTLLVSVTWLISNLCEASGGGREVLGLLSSFSWFPVIRECQVKKTRIEEKFQKCFNYNVYICTLCKDTQEYRVYLANILPHLNLVREYTSSLCSLKIMFSGGINSL